MKNQNFKKKPKKKQKLNIKFSKDLLDSIDIYLEKNQIFIFRISLAVSILFTLLLFDMKVSVGGDDANYIIRAYDFIHSFKYPSFQGPLYPIVLSVFVAVFGINIPILKLLSAIFLTSHLVAFYFVFRKRIPASILTATLIIISISAPLLKFGSLTYSEAFYMCAQMCFFLFFISTFIHSELNKFTKKKQIANYIYLGLFLLGLGLIRSMGYAMFITVIIYFLIQKQWKPAGITSLSFGIFSGLWKIIKLLLWSNSDLQFSNQASSLMMVHPYDPSQGTETFIGFIQRLIDNSNIYFSRFYFQILGLRPELIKVQNGLTVPENIPILAILVCILIVSAIIFFFRKNKIILFSGLFLAVSLGISFIILQTIWAAPRLLIPYFPILTLLCFAGIYAILKQKKIKTLQFIFPLLVVFIFFADLKSTTVKIKENQKVLKKNLGGNMLAGLTPDWQNYIKMTQWAAKNIPQNEVIACRKPNIAFIYTKRRFFGIYKVPPNPDPDKLLQHLNDNKVKYIVMASLRKYEAQKTQFTINTIYRYIAFIEKKYPGKIKIIKQIGIDEPAYLLSINE